MGAGHRGALGTAAVSAPGRRGGILGFSEGSPVAGIQERASLPGGRSLGPGESRDCPVTSGSLQDPPPRFLPSALQHLPCPARSQPGPRSVGRIPGPTTPQQSGPGSGGQGNGPRRVYTETGREQSVCVQGGGAGGGGRGSPEVDNLSMLRGLHLLQSRLQDPWHQRPQLVLNIPEPPPSSSPIQACQPFSPALGLATPKLGQEGL